jgi:hypothetical protein
MHQRCSNKLWPIKDSAETEGDTESSLTEGEILQLYCDIPWCGSISMWDVNNWLDIYKMGDGHEI